MASSSTAPIPPRSSGCGSTAPPAGSAWRAACWTELEERARAAGAPAVQLDTNRTLTEAIALYRKTGYVEIDAFNDEPYAHHWFRKDL